MSHAHSASETGRYVINIYNVGIWKIVHLNAQLVDTNNLLRTHDINKSLTCHFFKDTYSGLNNETLTVNNPRRH